MAIPGAGATFLPAEIPAFLGAASDRPWQAASRESHPGSMDEAMKYHHLGIPTTQKLEGEVHLPHLKMYVSGYGRNPYGIEWTRYEPDAPYPDLVKRMPHLAFEVDDIRAAVEGKKVIIEPNSPSPGVIVAFIEDQGVPIEFLQVDRALAQDGV